MNSLCMKTFIQAEIVSKFWNNHMAHSLVSKQMNQRKGKEQIGIVLRNLDNDQPSERLVEFVVCENTTGEAIAEQIVNKVHE